MCGSSNMPVGGSSATISEETSKTHKDPAQSQVEKVLTWFRKDSKKVNTTTLYTNAPKMYTSDPDGMVFFWPAKK